MKLIFCADPLNARAVDQNYEQEFRAAQQLGVEVSLISLESLLDGRVAQAVKWVPCLEMPESCIYRGWMLQPGDYELLYEALQQKRFILINSPEAYTNGHYFPCSYEAIQTATPRSVWVDKKDLTADLDVLLAKLHVFGERPVMVKDFAKSRKHEWEDACYIPNASDRSHVLKVLRNFVERQGSELSGGLVVREFVPLEQLGRHPQSGMPLAREYRLFFLDHKLMQCTGYWDEVTYPQTLPDLRPFIALAQGVASRFFTMDIAKTAKGDWMVIEIGDGQVSGLPGHADVERFYRAIITSEISS